MGCPALFRMKSCEEQKAAYASDSRSFISASEYGITEKPSRSNPSLPASSFRCRTRMRAVSARSSALTCFCSSSSLTSSVELRYPAEKFSTNTEKKLKRTEISTPMNTPAVRQLSQRRRMAWRRVTTSTKGNSSTVNSPSEKGSGAVNAARNARRGALMCRLNQSEKATLPDWIISRIKQTAATAYRNRQNAGRCS